ncbi:MAG: hypothetical protein RLZZ184_2577 [Cyanobacteriota bacterium]|jgi:uncharacterized protein YdcH (DUF465 family)
MTKKTRKEEIAKLQQEIKEMEANNPAIQKEAEEKAKEAGLQLFDKALEIAANIQANNKES